MPTALSPIRIARARRTSVVNAAETMEIGFNLALLEGIEIYACECAVLELIDTAASAFDTNWMTTSLHAETGALEGALDSFPADNTILNSEIIAEATLEIITQDEAATRGGSAATLAWTGPNQWNFVQLIGKPLLLASNITMRAITKGAATVANGLQWTIYYRYVRLTKSEAGDLFILRR